MLDERLLEKIGCPVCEDHPPLHVEADILLCRKCGREYPVADGIPILIPDRSGTKE